MQFYDPVVISNSWLPHVPDDRSHAVRVSPSIAHLVTPVVRFAPPSVLEATTVPAPSSRRAIRFGECIVVERFVSRTFFAETSNTSQPCTPRVAVIERCDAPLPPATERLGCLPNGALAWLPASEPSPCSARRPEFEFCIVGGPLGAPVSLARCKGESASPLHTTGAVATLSIPGTSDGLVLSGGTEFVLVPRGAGPVAVGSACDAGAAHEAMCHAMDRAAAAVDRLSASKAALARARAAVAAAESDLSVPPHARDVAIAGAFRAVADAIEHNARNSTDESNSAAAANGAQTLFEACVSSYELATAAALEQTVSGASAANHQDGRLTPLALLPLPIAEGRCVLPVSLADIQPTARLVAFAASSLPLPARSVALRFGFDGETRVISLCAAAQTKAGRGGGSEAMSDGLARAGATGGLRAALSSLALGVNLELPRFGVSFVGGSAQELFAVTATGVSAEVKIDKTAANLHASFVDLRIDDLLPGANTPVLVKFNHSDVAVLSVHAKRLFHGAGVVRRRGAFRPTSVVHIRNITVEAPSPLIVSADGDTLLRITGAVLAISSACKRMLEVVNTSRGTHSTPQTVSSPPTRWWSAEQLSIAALKTPPPRRQRWVVSSLCLPTLHVSARILPLAPTAAGIDCLQYSADVQGCQVAKYLVEIARKRLDATLTVKLGGRDFREDELSREAVGVGTVLGHYVTALRGSAFSNLWNNPALPGQIFAALLWEYLSGPRPSRAGFSAADVASVAVGMGMLEAPLRESEAAPDTAELLALVRSRPLLRLRWGVQRRLICLWPRDHAETNAVSPADPVQMLSAIASSSPQGRLACAIATAIASSERQGDATAASPACVATSALARLPVAAASYMHHISWPHTPYVTVIGSHAVMLLLEVDSGPLNCLWVAPPPTRTPCCDRRNNNASEARYPHDARSPRRPRSFCPHRSCRFHAPGRLCCERAGPTVASAELAMGLDAVGRGARHGARRCGGPCAGCAGNAALLR